MAFCTVHVFNLHTDFPNTENQVILNFYFKNLDHQNNEAEQARAELTGVGTDFYLIIFAAFNWHEHLAFQSFGVWAVEWQQC